MISPTYTDETVEKIARAICEVPGFYCVQSHGVVPFDHRSDYIQDLLREIARAALSVRPSTGSDAGDLVKRLERHAADFEDEMHALDATVATRIIHKSVRDDIREAAASIAALSEELAETRCENAALHGLCDQRFEEIAALGGENERLKAALEPFGKVTVLYREGVAWSLDDPDLDDLSIGELYIRAVDLRRAAKPGQMKGEG